MRHRKGRRVRLDHYRCRECREYNIRGDFNVRIGELGDRGMEEGGMNRCSKDNVTGNGERELVDWITEKG